MSRNCRIIAALAIALLAATPMAARAACDAANFPIAVDIGHTAQSPGATSARGKPEFDYNLALGRTVAAALHSAGFPVEMIVISGDSKTQLRKRVDKANALDPRLLISIHHDSAQARFLKTWEVGGRLLKYTDRFSGFSLFVSGANAKFEASTTFATRIADQLLGSGLGFSTHHAENIDGERKVLLDSARGIYEYRNLRVLKETRMPAVLLEAGVILNRDEEVALATPERRLAISDAIATAALQMCGDGKTEGLALR
jgi:N-acetylmuramoyl-L-alanine amidase